MLHCKPDRYWKITWYLQFFMVSCSLLLSRLTSSVQKFSLSFRPFRYERLGRPFLIRFLAFHSVVRTDIERNVSCKRSQFIPWQYSQIAPYGHSPQPTALLVCTAVFSKSPLNFRLQKLSLLGASSICAFVDTFLAPWASTVVWIVFLLCLFKVFVFCYSASERLLEMLDAVVSYVDDVLVGFPKSVL